MGNDILASYYVGVYFGVVVNKIAGYNLLYYFWDHANFDSSKRREIEDKSF